MLIPQLSLFMENRPGHLNAICRTLAEADINIVTLSMADTEQFGIIRLIVEAWERAKDVLEAQNFVVHVNKVVAIEVPDKPGGMAEVLDIVQAADINIEYMYAFCGRGEKAAIVLFCFDHPQAAISALTAAGRNVVGRVDLFQP